MANKSVLGERDLIILDETFARFSQLKVCIIIAHLDKVQQVILLTSAFFSERHWTR